MCRNGSGPQLIAGARSFLSLDGQCQRAQTTRHKSRWYIPASADEAISTGSLADLALLWEYIKARHSRLRTDPLSGPEQEALDAFLLQKRAEGMFLLRNGELEAYLPVRHKGKDLEKLIRLVSDTGFWDMLPNEGKDELISIVDGIRKLGLPS